MSTFSSVVRKPGQKITPKTAPRRNVQRTNTRHAAPPSLTPESQVASPSIEPVEERAQSQDAGHPETVLESTEIPTTSQAVETALPLALPPDEGTRASTEDSVNRVPRVSVEVVHPTSASPGIPIIHPVPITSPRSRPSAIPTVTTSSPSSARANRRSVNEPTPTPSDHATQEVESRVDTVSRSPTHERKRRKVIHAPTTDDVDRSEPRVSSPPRDNTPLILRNSLRHRRSESRTSDVLLQDATSQAAAVSELANSIENQTRSLRPRTGRPSFSYVDATDDQDAPANASAKATRSRKKQSRASAIEAIAEQVVQEAVSGRGNNRRQARLETPENAEEIQIDPEEVSMGDLVKDNKLGRKSETEKRMRENWQDIKRRRQEEIERRRAAAGSGRHGRQALAPTQDVPVDAQDLHVPQQIIVNGQIVVAAESREVAFGAGVEKAVIEDADVALEDDRIYKYVHQGTLGKHAGRKRATRWDDEQTELFYKGLRMFGTDFAMIANLFPDWDRKQIKLKYIAEDRVDSRRVQECVAAKEPVDLEEYSKMANQEFEDPDKLLSELAAEERRLREEDDRRRANEGYVLDGADIPLPSTERDPNEVDDVVDQDVGAGTAARTQAASTDHRDRVSALADNIVAAATGPKRKQTQQRKIKESAGRGRQAKKGRRPMEGVEERIGPIDEVER